MPLPLPRPTLLTRMSRAPKASVVRRTTASTPSGVDTSAATASTRESSCARVPNSAAAALRAASPRPQIVTRQPSATSARALAKPSPLLDPVMMAILSASWRSIRSAAGVCRAGILILDVIQDQIQDHILDRIQDQILDHILDHIQDRIQVVEGATG